MIISVLNQGAFRKESEYLFPYRNLQKTHLSEISRQFLIFKLKPQNTKIKPQNQYWDLNPLKSQRPTINREKGQAQKTELTLICSLVYLFESQSGKLRKISKNELKPNCDIDCRIGRKLEKDLFFLLFSSRPEQQRKKKKERKVCVSELSMEKREKNIEAQKSKAKLQEMNLNFFAKFFDEEEGKRKQSLDLEVRCCDWMARHLLDTEIYENLKFKIFFFKKKRFPLTLNFFFYY